MLGDLLRDVFCLAGIVVLFRSVPEYRSVAPWIAYIGYWVLTVYRLLLDSYRYNCRSQYADTFAFVAICDAGMGLPTGQGLWMVGLGLCGTVLFVGWVLLWWGRTKD